MDNSRNTEPGIRNATVQEPPNKGQKKKESRPVISAKTQTILDFLRGCSPYGADFIRVTVGYGTGNGGTATIEVMGMLAVNRFLNYGPARGNGTSNEVVIKHHQGRAQKLLEVVKDFVDISQLCRVSIVLMKISSDLKAVKDARGHLRSQLVANVNRNWCQNRNGVPDGQGSSRTHYLIETVVGFPISHSLIFYWIMQESKRNKETSLFKKPQDFRTVRIHFTVEAIEWLGGATKNDDGNTIGNHTLFYDLLLWMRLSPGRGDSSRRP